MALTTQVFDGKGILENYMQSANNFMTAVHGFGQQKLAERTQDNYDRISDQNERKLQDELTGNRETREYNTLALGLSNLKAVADANSTINTADREYFSNKQKLQTLASKKNLTPDEKEMFRTSLEYVKNAKANPGGRNNAIEYLKSSNDLLTTFADIYNKRVPVNGIKLNVPKMQTYNDIDYGWLDTVKEPPTIKLTK
jgi:hypothetical protein